MRKFTRIRPGARRIAALARRNGAIAHVAEGRDLRAPAMHRFRKAVQQQHQRRAGRARRDGVERERPIAICSDAGMGDPAAAIGPIHGETYSCGMGGIVQPGKSAVLEAA